MAAFPSPPPSLPSAVAEVYAKAKASGDLTFTPSAVVEDVPINGLTYRLRYCPSLQHKPKSPRDPATPKPNPFSPPHPPLLLAANTLGSGGYNLLLNRFPVTPYHFLLTTVQFYPQHLPLRPEDVAATYSVLLAWDVPGERLYGFFNSGPHSGASQPHRHVQFFPVAASSRRALFADEAPVASSSSEMVWTHPGVPFQHFVTRFSEKAEVGEVVGAYQTLLQRCRKVWGAENEGFSYNMGITRNWMVLAPRRRAEGKEGVEFNGTVLAGEIMVKREEDLEDFRNGELEAALAAIGFKGREVGT